MTLADAKKLAGKGHRVIVSAGKYDGIYTGVFIGVRNTELGWKASIRIDGVIRPAVRYYATKAVVYAGLRPKQLAQLPLRFIALTGLKGTSYREALADEMDRVRQMLLIPSIQQAYLNVLVAAYQKEKK